MFAQPMPARAAIGTESQSVGERPKPSMATPISSAERVMTFCGPKISARRSPASRVSAIASAKTAKVAAVAKGAGPDVLAQEQRRPFHHRAFGQQCADRHEAEDQEGAARQDEAFGRRVGAGFVRHQLAGGHDGQGGEDRLKQRCWARKLTSHCAKAPPISAPVTVPKLQKAWQRVMIRRLSARSVWLALAFIATSIVAMERPQRKSVSPRVRALGRARGR